MTSTFARWQDRSQEARSSVHYRLDYRRPGSEPGRHVYGTKGNFSSETAARKTAEGLEPYGYEWRIEIVTIKRREVAASDNA